MTQEALKLALEALEANYLLVNGTETHGGLEQCLDGYYSSCFDTDPINKQTEEAITAIKEALAQPEQEPVIDKSAAIRIATALGWSPQRTWQGLTDEEISELIRATHNTGSFVCAIEAKLKEKNCAG